MQRDVVVDRLKLALQREGYTVHVGVAALVDEKVCVRTFGYSSALYYACDGSPRCG